MRDHIYSNYSYQPSEFEHQYHANVHLLCEPVLLTQLARLCRPDTLQPDVTWLTRDLYTQLVHLVLSGEFPRTYQEIRTRMFTATPYGVWGGDQLESNTKAVTVDIARAGILPSQIAFEALTRVLQPDAVRQDHVFMNRKTNEKGEVVGIHFAGSKIGGPVDNAYVLIPDPMGATGQSMGTAVELYKDLEGGPPKKIIAMHLIVTPEYIKYMNENHPDVIIYALRLDRGLSAPEALKLPFGQAAQQEKGLNERQYIVPGAGGLGEVLNNSYV